MGENREQATLTRLHKSYSDMEDTQQKFYDALSGEALDKLTDAMDYLDTATRLYREAIRDVAHTVGE